MSLHLHRGISTRGAFITTSTAVHAVYRYIAVNFRVVQIFAFFEGRAVNAKINWEKLPRTGISHAKACGGCGFLALKRKYYNRENFF